MAVSGRALLLLFILCSLLQFSDGHDVADEQHCLIHDKISMEYIATTPTNVTKKPCDFATHICRARRMSNLTHYSVRMDCAPQIAVVYECVRNTAPDYFFCYDVPAERHLVPDPMVRARECCCRGQECNRIEYVKSLNSLMTYDKIRDPRLRSLYSCFISLCACSTICCSVVLVSMLFIFCRDALREDNITDEVAWQANKKDSVWRVDLGDDSEEEGNETPLPPPVDEDKMMTKSTQDGSESQLRNRKKGKKTTKEIAHSDKHKSKKAGASSRLTLPKGPTVTTGGHVQYVSMMNENSTFSDLD